MKEYKKRILLADDDAGILDAMKMMLEDEGYDVKTSINGQTVRKITQFHPDVMLLDIWMSGVDGRDICKKLKGNEQTKHIPIIMISANKDTATIAKEAGADDFIGKPFQMNELLTKVAKYATNRTN